MYQNRFSVANAKIVLPSIVVILMALSKFESVMYKVNDSVLPKALSPLVLDFYKRASSIFTSVPALKFIVFDWDGLASASTTLVSEKLLTVSFSLQ